MTPIADGGAGRTCPAERRSRSMIAGVEPRLAERNPMRKRSLFAASLVTSVAVLTALLVAGQHAARAQYSDGQSKPNAGTSSGQSSGAGANAGQSTPSSGPSSDE